MRIFVWPWIRLTAKASVAGGGSPHSSGIGGGSGARLDEIIDRGLTPTVETDYERWQPLHWVLEAPDIFTDRGISEKDGGFDAIIGNPPFLGGKKLSPAIGTNHREWLVNRIAAESRGNADLVAYFFLRAHSLLKGRGTLGLMATNTVAQGDTREVGLDQMLASGFMITRAVQSETWPTIGASLQYAKVWGSLAAISDELDSVCDDLQVRWITSLLEPGGRVMGTPCRLVNNRGTAFIGCNMNGTGFRMPKCKAQEMLSRDSVNYSVLFPFFNGEDLNQVPDLVAAEWAVDFFNLELSEASTYREPFEWVERNVRPHRETLTKKPRERERWWRYERDATSMRNAIAELSSVLAVAVTSKTIVPVRLYGKLLPSHAVCLFAIAAYAEQAVLSSSIHQIWVVKYGSTMGDGTRYMPSDVFETFPRPVETERLDVVGRTLEETRKEIMLRRWLGLTKLYNLINDPGIANGDDPDVEKLRAIHVEIDKAVMEAYGWSDVSLDHGFHEYRQMVRWTVSPAARVEILDRLLEENHRRAAIEAAANPTGRGRRLSDDDDTELPFS